jgi:hypothetical protein
VPLSASALRKFPEIIAFPFFDSSGTSSLHAPERSGGKIRAKPELAAIPGASRKSAKRRSTSCIQAACFLANSA